MPRSVAPMRRGGPTWRRLGVLLALTLSVATRCAGDSSSGETTSTQEEAAVAAHSGNASHDGWARWMPREHFALRYRRTAAELQAFRSACAWLAPAWHAAHVAHAEMLRVLVWDVRHNFNGLGDAYEPLMLLLRIGRALGRATFMHFDGCNADPDAPPAYGPSRRRERGRGFNCSFDPPAFVSGFGGLNWRWDATQRRRLAKAHSEVVTPLLLQYTCLPLVPDGPAGDPWHGCERVALRFAANDSVTFEAKGTVDGAADALLRYIHDELREVPVLRIATRDQYDFERAGRLPWVCAAAGHPWPAAATAEAQLPPQCSLACETFASWRPKRRLWAALEPALTQLEAWDGAIGLLLRSGVADQVASHGGETLQHAADAIALEEAGASAHSGLQHDLAALLTPCPEGTQHYLRNRLPGAPPCATFYEPDAVVRAAPNETAAHTCAPAEGAKLSVAEREMLLGAASGPLGAYIGCAALAARALARASPPSGGSAGASGGGRYGVMMFSDAPAFKCLLEGSALARAGHVGITPSAPGHVSLAPDGEALKLVALATLADHYLMGLLDAVVLITTTAYSGAAQLRRALHPRLPPDSRLQSLQPAYERWFDVGRDTPGAQTANDAAMLKLLLSAPANANCPTTTSSVARAASAYARSAEEAQDAAGMRQ